MAERLADCDSSVREVAVAILSKLPIEEFGKLAAQVASFAENEQSDVRTTSLTALRLLTEAELVAHTDACVQQLEKDDIMLREAAIDTLRKLAQEALAEHATSLVTRLEDGEDGIREAALQTLSRLPTDILSQQAGAMVALLDTTTIGEELSTASVRCAALRGLADLPPADRARVMGAIVARMQDLDEKVRHAALGALCSQARSEHFTLREAS